MKNSKRVIAFLVAMAATGMNFPCALNNSGYRASYAVVNAAADSISIKTQPADATVLPGKGAKFSVEAEGDSLSYLWKYKLNGSDEWVDWTSKRTAEISVAYKEERNGMNLKCAITDAAGNTKETDVVTLTYGVADTIKIVTQPVDVTVAEGKGAPFSVEAEGDTLTYLWKYQLAGTDEWVNWTSKRTANISVSYKAERNGMKLKCAITDKNGNTKETNVVTLTYGVASPIRIVTQPANAAVLEGKNALFSVEAEGDTLTYLWKYKIAGTEEWINWNTKTTPDISVAYKDSRNGMKLKCAVTDKNGNTKETNEVTLSYYKALSITGLESATISSEADATFTVSANGTGNMTYAWESSADGVNWEPIANSNSATLTVAGSTATTGTKYRCKVTDSYGQAKTSNAATLTVLKNIEITKQPADAIVKQGKSGKFSVTATGEELTYLWQYKYSNSNDWVDWKTKTTPEISVAYSVARNNMLLRCLITDATGRTALTDEVTLQYYVDYVAPKITSQPAAKTVNEKSKVTFSVAAEGVNLLYQWQKASNSTTPSWTDIEGANSANYSFTAALSDNKKLYRCVITDGTETVESDSALLKVKEIDAVIENGTEEVTINKGDTYPLPLKGKGLTYYSNNKEIATVDSKGVVKSFGEGTVYVFVLDTSGHKYFYKIHVVDPYEALTFDEPVVNVRPDESTRLYVNKSARYVVTDEEKTNIWWDYYWYYDNSWVDFTGYVPGTYNVIAYTDDGEMTFCTVNVEGDVTDAELNTAYTGTLEVGDAYSDKYYGSNTWYRYTNNTDNEVMVTFDTTQIEGDNDTADAAYTLYSKGKYANSEWYGADVMVNAQVYLAPGEEVLIRPQINDRMTSVYNFTINATPYNPVDYTVGQTISNVTLDRKDYTEYVFTPSEPGEYELTANSRTPFYWQLEDPENNYEAVQSGSETSAVMTAFNLLPGHQYALRFAPSNKNDEGVLTFTLAKAEDIIVDAEVNTQYSDVLKAYNTKYYKFELGDPAINNLLDVYEFTETWSDGVSYEVLNSDMYTPFENIHSSANGRRLYISEPTTIYVKVTNDSSSARVPELILRKYGRNMTTVNSGSSGTKNITANSVQWYEFTAPANGRYLFDFFAQDHEISVNYEVYFGDELDYSNDYSAYNDDYSWHGYYDADENYQEVYGYYNRLDRSFVLREGEKIAVKVTGDFNADNQSTVIPYDWSVSCEENYPTVELTLDTPTAGATVNGQKTYFEFTAPKAGVYYFWSQTRAHMYGDLYTDLGGDWLAGSDGGGQFGNFCLQYHLTAGQKVVLCPRQYDNNDVEYEVVVSQTNSSDDWTPTYDHKALTLNTETAGYYRNYYEFDTFSFTASKAGTYVFTVAGEDYDVDAELYSDESLKNEIGYYYYNNEVIMEYELAKGQTVYLKPRNNDSDDYAAYTVKVVKKQINNVDVLNGYTYEGQNVSALTENWYKFTAPFDGEFYYYFFFDANNWMNVKAYTKNQDGTYSEAGYERYDISNDYMDIKLSKGQTIYIKAWPYYTTDEVEFSLIVSGNPYCNGHEVSIPEEYYSDYSNMYLDGSDEWVFVKNPAQNLYSLNIVDTEDHSNGYRNIRADLYTADGTLIASGTSVKNVVTFENPFDNEAIGENTEFYLHLVEVNNVYIGNVTVSYEPVVYEEGSSD